MGLLQSGSRALKLESKALQFVKVCAATEGRGVPTRLLRGGPYKTSGNLQTVTGFSTLVTIGPFVLFLLNVLRCKSILGTKTIGDG